VGFFAHRRHMFRAHLADDGVGALLRRGFSVSYDRFREAQKKTL